MFYNLPMSRFTMPSTARGLLRPVLAALLLCALLLLSACDYPEEGYFQLDLLDENGEVFAIFPFAVRELVDDTSLTYGFALRVPQAGRSEIVELELLNGQDLTKRSWHFGIAGSDSGAGDIDLELTHANERLSYTGVYKPWPSGKTFKVGGYILAGETLSTLVSNGPMPPVPFSISTASRIELRRIDKAEFEDYLGGKVEQAKILKAQQVPQLIADASDADYEAVPQTTPVPSPGSGARDDGEPKEKPRPPAMGGKR